MKLNFLLETSAQLSFHMKESFEEKTYKFKKQNGLITLYLG